MIDRLYDAFRAWVSRSPKRELLIVAALGATMTLGLTVPWRPNPVTIPSVYCGDAEFFAQFDAAIWTYMLAWGAQHPASFYDAPILLPVNNPLAATDPRLTECIWTVPLFRIFPPVQAWGFAIWLALLATAVGTYYAGRAVTASRWGGVATMVLFAFGLFRISQLARIEAVFAPFLALSVAALIRHLDSQDRRWKALFAACLAAALIEYSYTAVALMLTVPPVLLYGIWRRRTGLMKGLLPFLTGTAVALVLLIPVAVVYARFHASTGIERALVNVDFTSAHLASWLTAPSGLVLPPFGPLGDATPDNNLFPGIVACILAVFGIRALWVRSREGVLIGILALLLSFGTLRFAMWELGLPAFRWSTPYELLYDWLLPLKAIRAPARLGVLAHLVLAFAGAMAILRLVRVRRGWIVASLILLVAFLEARSGMHELKMPVVASDDACSRWLSSQPGRFAVLEAPVGRHKVREENLLEARAMMAALVHGKPTPNGGLAANFSLHESIAANVANPSHQEAQRVIRALGIRYIVTRDDDTASSFAQAGYATAFIAPDGGRIFEVPSPLTVPETPLQLVSRLTPDPVIEAARLPGGSQSGRILAPAGLEVQSKKLFHLPLKVRNSGTTIWAARSAVYGSENGDVAVGVCRWRSMEDGKTVLNPRGKPLVGTGILPWNMLPGETGTVIVPCFAPPRPGRYRADLDFFVQGRGWVSPTAAPPASVVISVQ